MSEEMLIAHCSPTLAGMKIGSLFNCKCEVKCHLQEQIKEWNKMLNPKGVEVILLRTMRDRALVYVYRPKKLEKEMTREEIKSFLKEQGYKGCQIEGCIEELVSKLGHCEEFPHEIGLFLGYPLEDIKAFIENKGKNCKCVGYWKAYNNEQEARKTFERYRRCTRIYRKKLEEGVPIHKLTINI